ncbi:MAG: hypothetical protein DCC68_02445 [Planctomycetota bacterium]|nr:MAG: hypothetical protein DCC68_02445 [Planctomycetota bacterium]
MERGKAVGVVFDGLQTPGEGLVRAAKLPRLARATFRHASLSAAAIRPLGEAEKLAEITIEEPVNAIPEEAIAALGELGTLRKLTLRGVAIGEDEEAALKNRLPRVIVVLEPPSAAGDEPRSTAQMPDKVQSVW